MLSMIVSPLCVPLPRDHRVTRRFPRSQMMRLIGLSVDEHICRVIQLIWSISCSVATGQHSATGVTSLPFHNAVIPPVSDDHRALLIGMETVRPVELVGGLPLSVSSSDGDPVLCPSGGVCNEREVCVCEITENSSTPYSTLCVHVLCASFSIRM